MCKVQRKPRRKSDEPSGWGRSGKGRRRGGVREGFLEKVPPELDLEI